MSDQSKSRTDALEAAAAKRIELKEALSQVERVAASPSAAAGWRDRLLEELEKLRQALLEHIDEVEAEDGLLHEILTEAPRLANQIESMRTEHGELTHRIEQNIVDVRDREDVIDLRSGVLETLAAVARHRQRGSDLVYDGYNVDIGGS